MPAEGAAREGRAATAGWLASNRLAISGALALELLLLHLDLFLAIRDEPDTLLLAGRSALLP